MTEWKVCPLCEKERPLTCFRMDKQGYAMAICLCCSEKIRKKESRKKYRKGRRSRPSPVPWSKEETELLNECVGLTLLEAQGKIGRTPGAIKKMMSRMGLHMENCKIAQKSPATGKG